MNDNHKELISIGFTVGIVVFTLFILHKFLPSIIWAAIIVIATYPLYKRWHKFFGEKRNFSAAIFTILIALLLLVPLSWLLTLLITESQLLINFLQQINREGGSAPDFFSNVPLIGNELIQYWDEHVGQPGILKICFLMFISP